jgi:hypothetical protein
VADSVKIDASLVNVVDMQVSPNLAARGIKFSISLDDRTPSHADDSMATQYNTVEVWSLPYWQRFLDQMARNRLNSLSLWNRHPFPSMVRVPDDPNVALSDVKAETGLLNGGNNTTGHLLAPKPRTRTSWAALACSSSIGGGPTTALRDIAERRLMAVQ